jgi:hypothetical protein
MIKINHSLVEQDIVQFLNRDAGDFGYYVREGKGKVWLKLNDNEMLFYDYDDPNLADEDIKELNRIKLVL